MPRRGGNTQHSERRKHAGHRMHRRSRVARKAARMAKRRGSSPWGRGAV